MMPTSGRLVFKMGDALPADDPVAVFVVAVSTAWNDLMTAAKWMTGGDYNAPRMFEVSDAEQQYLLRLTIAQLHELRETIKYARRDDSVVRFLESLPDQAKEDLDRVMRVAKGEDRWVRGTVKFVRNQTNHYGGRYGWAEIEWAMKQLAVQDSEIEMRSPKLVGMRLRFADDVAVQHLSRKWPEYDTDPDAELDEGTIKARLETLLKTISEVVVAAQNLVVAVIDMYFGPLLADVVRSEDVT